MKQNRSSSWILLLSFFTGLSLLLYPTVADYWNSFHASEAIAHYEKSLENISDEENLVFLEEALEYNWELARGGYGCEVTDEISRRYERTLDPDGSGIMGYVEIDKIRVDLPIYHGTDASVLQVAAGHVAWSSLPVGGPGSHCIISGHRGLPSAKLFTNLDWLREGDLFTLNVLGRVFTYEIDQILIVEPDDITALQIVEGEDYCSLVTCTPYGINSHRLVLRGRRVENVNETKVVSEAVKIDEMIMALFLFLPLYLTVMILSITISKHRPAEEEEDGDEGGLYL